MIVEDALWVEWRQAHANDQPLIIPERFILARTPSPPDLPTLVDIEAMFLVEAIDKEFNSC